MIKKLMEYFDRQKRHSTYEWWEFSAGKLREYPETLELVRTVRDQGATHFEDYPKDYDTVFYRMNGDILQMCSIKRPFSNKPVLTSWSDLWFPPPNKNIPAVPRKIPSKVRPIEDLFEFGE